MFTLSDFCRVVNEEIGDTVDDLVRAVKALVVEHRLLWQVQKRPVIFGADQNIEKKRGQR